LQNLDVWPDRLLDKTAVIEETECLFVNSHVSMSFLPQNSYSDKVPEQMFF
jgi:hypothetical protein